MAKRVPALVLAGGKSSRMGEDKAELQFADRMLAHYVADRLHEQGCDPVMINSSNSALSHQKYALVPDNIDGFQGPLAGILAGLRWVIEYLPETTHLLVTPTDAPFFPADLYARLTAGVQTPSTIAMAARGDKLEPAFALWPVAVVKPLTLFLNEGQDRSLRGFASRHELVLVDFADQPAECFHNINTPEELHAARQLLNAE